MKYIFSFCLTMSVILSSLVLLQPNKNVLIVCDGNSLTYGQGVEEKLYAYPVQLDSLLRLETGTYHVVNLGVNGQTTPEMYNDARSQVSSYYNRDSENILIAWEVRNHLVRDCPGIDEAMKAYRNYCMSMKKRGFSVYAVTMLPSWTRQYCNDTTYNAIEKLETDRQIVNKYIREHHTEFSSGLIDLAALESIGSKYSNLPENYTFTNRQPAGNMYYVDGTHLNERGYGLVAEYIRNRVVEDL